MLISVIIFRKSVHIDHKDNNFSAYTVYEQRLIIAK